MAFDLTVFDNIVSLSIALYLPAMLWLGCLGLTSIKTDVIDVSIFVYQSDGGHADSRKNPDGAL